MPLPIPKTGAYTQQELLGYWKTVVDDSYSRVLVEQGEGKGLEVYTQGMAQLVRVSNAIDRTLQAMFIMAWSGQTNPPAGGAARARVTLHFSRTKAFEIPIVFSAGDMFVEEQTTDYADTVGISVLPGRRYTPLVPLVFFPGDAGDLSVQCEAEKDGDGYNNPLPGTIHAFSQPGSEFQNDKASVQLGATSNRLVAAPDPDVFVPEHVGQYVLFTAGSNRGQVRRIVGYEGPNSTVPHGGVAFLAKTFVLRVSAVSGTFLPGEVVDIGAGTNTALFLALNAAGVMIIERVLVTPTIADTIAGQQSGATATLSAIEQGDLVAETSTAAWEVLDWTTGLGFSVTNHESPTGGRAPMLDELGAERDIFRSPGEVDDSYRLRIHTLPDVVSPNAIRRAGNRALSRFNLSVCLREVGSKLFPGMYYDGDPSNADRAVAFAYDIDAVSLLGTPSGTFFEGEEVVQDNGGVLATGRAIFFHDPSTNTPPFDEQLAPPIFDGVANVRGTFVVGVQCVGKRSGTTLTPTAVVGTGLHAEDRFKLSLDYIEMRAFFLIGVPPIIVGDFGIAYDFGAVDAYDASPFLSFYDGYPATGASSYRNVWQSILEVVAGGVSFDLYLETTGCT